MIQDDPGCKWSNSVPPYGYILFFEQSFTFQDVHTRAQFINYIIYLIYLTYYLKYIYDT